MADLNKVGKRNRYIRFSILIFVLTLTTWMGPCSFPWEKIQDSIN